LGEIRRGVDVGFGIGEHYPFITEKEKVDGTFIGVDLDRFKLEHFSSLHPEITVLQASAFRLPFAASTVDLVQMLAILEHFPSGEITGLLDESLRILKPGGILIACYPAEGGLLLKFCQRVMHGYLKCRTGFDLDKGAIHRHLAAAEEIRSILGGRRELERIESRFYPLGVKSVELSLFVNETYRKR
jgi:SAM-dependent methyltransferase